MTLEEILQELQSLENPGNVEGMARFGIRGKKVFGVSLPELRAIARRAGKSHALARQLWKSGAHEARLLACLVEDPDRVTASQMERWALDFDNWAICDGCCLHLFDKTSFAFSKAAAWSRRNEEFVKHAGFALMAVLAVHDKQAPDSSFSNWMPLIEKASTDSRNFVKKAVNWALRQIGKRNKNLHQPVVGRGFELDEALRPGEPLGSTQLGWILETLRKRFL